MWVRVLPYERPHAGRSDVDGWRIAVGLAAWGVPVLLGALAAVVRLEHSPGVIALPFFGLPLAVVGFWVGWVTLPPRRRRPLLAWCAVPMIVGFAAVACCWTDVQVD